MLEDMQVGLGMPVVEESNQAEDGDMVAVGKEVLAEDSLGDVLEDMVVVVLCPREDIQGDKEGGWDGLDILAVRDILLEKDIQSGEDVQAGEDIQAVGWDMGCWGQVSAWPQTGPQGRAGPLSSVFSFCFLPLSVQCEAFSCSLFTASEKVT